MPAQKKVAKPAAQTAPAKPRAKRESRAVRQTRALHILKVLIAEYPHPFCALNHTSAFELLIATILSAQCTDARVNLVTAELFRKYRTPQDYLAVPLTELETDIRSTGFYHNKAKNIQGLCRALLDEHQGEVPQTMEALNALPGVGRKTANVVLGNAFGIASGVVVDTHVTRLTHLLGLVEGNTAEKIEQELNVLIPQDEWINFSHRLIAHGRAICIARRPQCQRCVLAPLCPSAHIVNKA